MSSTAITNLTATSKDLNFDNSQPQLQTRQLYDNYDQYDSSDETDRAFRLRSPKHFRKHFRGPGRHRGKLRRWGHRRRFAPVFTEWSPWSKCDIHCKQERERFCLDRRKCGSVRHLEERLCSRQV